MFGVSFWPECKTGSGLSFVLTCTMLCGAQNKTAHEPGIVLKLF